MIPVVVLGDSHASVFNSETLRLLLPEYTFEVTSVGGATVSGLKNPNAVTQAMPQFTAALEASTANTVIVMLGEVDTGFVIWHRAQKYGNEVSQMLQLAVDNYQKLLEDIKQTHHVVCISTPLPTIRDGMDWGEVANLRKEVTATLAERTRLTIEFNKLMEIFCARQGISHINMDSLSMDDSGCLKESLRNSDPSDHHYDLSAHARMIAPLLIPVLERYSNPDQSSGVSRPAEKRHEAIKPTFLSRLVDRIFRVK
jgi:hypothetical protein